MFKMIVMSLAFTCAASSVFGQARTPDTMRPLSHVAPTGKTMPPNRADSPTAKDDIGRHSSNDRQEDAVAKSICVGCGVR